MAPFNGLLELALFAGAGGGILGGHLLGTRCVGAVEIEDYPRRVLQARQEDGCLPPFPIWDDIRTFRIDNPECADYLLGLRSVADRLLVSGGFPCQDLSVAGTKRGLDGNRSGLWFEMLRVVSEIRPRLVFVENSPNLVRLGLSVVSSGLAQIGYDSKWKIIGASDVGAPHRRKRLWILANPDRDPIQRLESRTQQGEYRRPTRLQGGTRGWNGWWNSEPHMGRMVDGLAIGVDIHGTHVGLDVGRVAKGVRDRVGRLKAIGNGQVPACASESFLNLLEILQWTQRI